MACFRTVQNRLRPLLCLVLILPLTGCGSGGGGGVGTAVTAGAVSVSAFGLLPGSTLSQTVPATSDLDPATPGVQQDLQVSNVPVATVLQLFSMTARGVASSQEQLLATTQANSLGMAIFPRVTFSDGQRLRVLAPGGSVDFYLNVTVQGTAPGPNQAPVVTVQSQRTVAAAATVTLTASATDADGDALGYSWTQLSGPAVILSNAQTAAAGFIPQPGLYDFRVAVSDSRSGVSTADISVLAVEMSSAVQADLAAAGRNLIAFHKSAGSKSAGSCQYCHGAVVMSKSLDARYVTVHLRHTFSGTGPQLACVDCHQAVDTLEKSAAHVRRQVDMNLCYGCHTRFFAGSPN